MIVTLPSNVTIFMIGRIPSGPPQSMDQGQLAKVNDKLKIFRCGVIMSVNSDRFIQTLIFGYVTPTIRCPGCESCHPGHITGRVSISLGPNLIFFANIHSTKSRNAERFEAAINVGTIE